MIKMLKLRLLGLAAIEKSRARQNSRITWMKKGDANTRFFHLMASSRKKKNFIHSLQTDNRVVTSQQAKQEVIFRHFQLHSGTYMPRSCSLNFHELGWEPKHLSHLELPFTEDEVRKVITKAPQEKAPSPDGFIGMFFSSCWDIIKGDLLNAVMQFYSMNQQGLFLLNQAYVVLIPKKGNPQKVADFKPIGLTHSFVKIMSKILANKMGPELNHLISINQSTFIKKRCIHDNFVYVQQVIKDLHKKKVPALFIKLDICKAFDSANWPYLISIMTHLGFGQRWRNWISALWCTTSSTYLLNGEPRKKVLHCRGIKQGDPLSPMLFLLAMELLHLLFLKAQQVGLITTLISGCNSFRVSLYADDAALFIKPSKHDVEVSDSILSIFAEASGLITNINKTEYYPIRCQSVNLNFLAQQNKKIADFPCTYLGLPLHFKKIPKDLMLQVIQKISNRMPGWKKNFRTYPGRELLVKTVLSATPTYFLTVFKLPKWGFVRINRFRRSFLWKGQDPDNIRGGHCLVNW
jgi:hypothetical protein